MTGCKEIAGVTSVKVDPNSNKLIVRFDSSVTTRERVLAAVESVIDSVH